MWASSIYEEWDCEKDARCHGMRHKKKYKHGIVRTEYANGTVEEASFVKDERHGLRRFINGSYVSVELWANRTQHFRMLFNGDFVEIERRSEFDYHGIDVKNALLLTELYPYAFCKERNDPKMLRNMLQSTAPELSDAITETLNKPWLSFTPMTVDLFEQYWPAPT